MHPFASAAAAARLTALLPLLLLCACTSTRRAALPDSLEEMARIVEEQPGSGTVVVRAGQHEVFTDRPASAGGVRYPIGIRERSRMQETDDSIRGVPDFRDWARTTDVPWADVTRVSYSRRDRAAGLGDGLLSGAVGTGLVIGGLAAATYEPCTGWCILRPGSRGEAFQWGFLGGAAIGGVIGAIVGVISGSRKVTVWERAPAPH
jgi:hypothetical protein